MPAEVINLPFNKDSMSVRDMKDAVEALQSILQQFDNILSADPEEDGWASDETYEFCLRVMQVRERYSLNA